MSGFYKISESDLLTIYAIFGRIKAQKIIDDKYVEVDLSPQHNMLELNFDNLITKSDAKNSSIQEQKEIEELMRLNKGMRKRHDGRYDWRIMIAGVIHYLINSDPYKLAKQIREYKKAYLKTNHAKEVKPQESRKLIDLCEKYVRVYKSNVTTIRNYRSVLKNHMQGLTRNIETYTKSEIQEFFNGLNHFKKQMNYCWFIIKAVFADALADRTIKVNPIANMKSPAKNSERREWIDLDGQRKILENLHKCKIGNELLFYLLTGARCDEAFHTTIDFEKRIVFIDGTKTDTAARYIRVSQKFCDYFKPRWNNMFKCGTHYYSKNTTPFLKSIGIVGKSLHSIRHSFSTNIYYLGIDHKKHQYLMGHKDIKTTYNIYTSYDPSITKDDVVSLFGDWLPNEF